ncbi:MAG: aspartate ammonia-lyase [Candidatus Nanohaloarchaea archaeon]|nr:aspartate ammonia-lyase [Candidatus Nanohaloarchaea archaeon]
MGTRQEADSLGTVDVPADAYYGSFTQRARKNFDLTGGKPPSSFIRAFGFIKKAAARTNHELGLLQEKKAEAIVDASDEVVDGTFDDEFVLDMIQAGAGTPFHMNANEVIANRATELLGGGLGEYLVHPNDDVNMGQSSNNVVPTAIRLACLELSDTLLEEMEELSESLRDRADEYNDTVKVGRTHLQDAVPVTLGQELDAYATHVEEAIRRLDQARDGLREVGLGGNATGTGINTPEGFRDRLVDELSEVTGRELRATDDALATTQSMTPFSDLSGALKRFCLDMIKAANDMMLLNSGPVAGIGELELPEVEPGSSIMPGKVNPSVTEAFKMSCIQVLGNDEAVSVAAKEGDLELNVNTPLIARNLFDSLDLLASAIEMWRKDCIEELEADEARIEELLSGSTATATALSPYIGYDRTAEAVHEALESSRTFREVVEERGWMTTEELDGVLQPERMTEPHGVDEELRDRVRERLND